MKLRDADDLINRFSNINWAAFLLGGLWGWFNRFSFWTFLWAMTVYLLLASIGSVSIPTKYGFASMFIAMSAIAIWLALRGNRMLLDDIRENGFSPEKEQEERATTSLQQQNQALYGFIYKVSLYLWMITRVDDHSIFSLSMLFVLLVIDILSLLLVLTIALVFNVEKNELYPKGKFKFKLAHEVPVRRPRRQKAKTIEYSDWNPFDEKKDAHVKEAEIEQGRIDQACTEQAHIEADRKKGSAKSRKASDEHS